MKKILSFLAGILLLFVLWKEGFMDNNFVGILAIIASPLIAVLVSSWLQDRKEKRRQQILVFSTLIATKALPLSPQHVEALNKIDIEFFGNRKITEARKQLLDNFDHYPQDTSDPEYQKKLDSCGEKAENLLIDLIYEMAQALGYNFDKVYIKRGIRFPKGHADYMEEQELIRRGIVGLLSGIVPISVKIVEPSAREDKQK